MAKVVYSEQGKEYLQELQDEYKAKLEKLITKEPSRYHKPSGTYEANVSALAEANSKFVVQELEPTRNMPVISKLLFTICAGLTMGFSLFFLWVVSSGSQILGSNPFDVLTLVLVVSTICFAFLAFYGLNAPAKYFPDYSRQNFQQAIKEVTELKVDVEQERLNFQKKEQEFADDVTELANALVLLVEQFNNSEMVVHKSKELIAIFMQYNEMHEEETKGAFDYLVEESSMPPRTIELPQRLKDIVERSQGVESSKQ